MANKKNTSLERVLGRLDRLDSVNLANLVQRLARERSLLEDIFNTLQEGVLVVGSDAVIEYANDSAHRLLGVGEDSLPGRTLWRLVPGLHASLGSSLEEARPIVSREIELTYPEPRTMRLAMMPFRQELAGRGQYAVILSDITAEKRAVGQRLEDERASSILLLAAGVAHELGNPLNSLTIHLQLIGRKLRKQKRSPELDSVAESLAVCRDEVQRLDGIIRNFLEAIRPRPPNLSEVHLPEVLGEVLRVQAREFADRQIRVEVDADGGLPTVMADRDQLKQVFFNLTKNALEAMQPGGTLRVRSRADDDSVFLRFADTGSGIRPDDLVKLFQPYHTTKVGGHGLGLMIVQRIMRAHGGQVGIESKEGIGTVVTLQLPRKDRRVRMLAAGPTDAVNSPPTAES
ncbi:MAG TPA: ATP-binding protein [Opitutaceae bacterium]|jgi:PAS domain S-box-containing protein|nr:ATP-binding protein [Opitutaceae bacterium]